MPDEAHESRGLLGLRDARNGRPRRIRAQPAERLSALPRRCSRSSNARVGAAVPRGTASASRDSDAARASSGRARHVVPMQGCNGSGRVGLPLLVPGERPTRLAGDDRFHRKQQRPGRSASSVRTAQLHGKQQPAVPVFGCSFSRRGGASARKGQPLARPHEESFDAPIQRWLKLSSLSAQVVHISTGLDTSWRRNTCSREAGP
jgi:hypothetical protein